jgi:hypothetical protein
MIMIIDQLAKQRASYFKYIRCKLLFVLLCSFLFVTVGFSQEMYIFLSDQTGIDRDVYKPVLEDKASLIFNYIEETNIAFGESILPADFKVYDFGAYLHNASQMELDEILNLSRYQANNENRIIFNKISSGEGIWKKVIIEINLSDNLAGCYDNQYFQSELQFEFDAYYSQNANNFQNACQMAMERYLVLLKNAVCCYYDQQELDSQLEMRVSIDCSNSELVEIVDQNIVGFNDYFHNNFISRSGSIITFQDKPEMVGFFNNGTVARFKVGNELYRCCGDRVTGEIFKGYRTNCEKGTDEFIFHRTWKEGDQDLVNFGINKSDCKAHIYTLDYVSIVDDLLRNGGIDSPLYYDDIEFNYEVTYEKLYNQSGLSEYELLPHYIETSYYLIADFTENGLYPCPDFNILKKDLSAYSGSNLIAIFPDNDGFWQKTNKGWVYYRVNNQGLLDLWLYDPQSNNFVGFFPLGTNWENDGHLMSALYIALVEAVQDVDTYIYLAEGVGVAAAFLGSVKFSLVSGLVASGLYMYKDDKNNAILSSLLVIGDIIIVAKNGRFFLTRLDDLFIITKGANNSVDVSRTVSGLSETTIGIVKNYGFKTRETASQFLNDLGSLPFREFLEAAGESGIKAWEVLSHTGLRTNIKWLEDVSKWIDDGLILTSTVTKVSIKKAGLVVGEISENLLKVKYAGFGSDVICHSTKTTKVIGKYQPPGGAPGSKNLIESGITKYGENPGGVNVLNDLTNTQGWSDQQIWDQINKPWLDAAANRGDIIRVVSDPLDLANIYKGGNPANGLSFFGREVERLDQLGYAWNSSLFQYVK